MIAFYDVDVNADGGLIGTVKIVDGKFVPSNPNVSSMYGGKTPEEFIERFKNYNNGYMASFEVPDDAEPDATYPWGKG
jgi:hypothetical protein